MNIVISLQIIKNVLNYILKYIKHKIFLNRLLNIIYLLFFIIERREVKDKDIDKYLDIVL
jgi:hypothetical protein